MVRLVCLPIKGNRPKIALPHNPGSNDPHGWDLLLDLCFFYLGQRDMMSDKAQRNPRYRLPWADFKEQAMDAIDMELLVKINIVESYKNLLPGYIAILEEQSQYSILDSRVKYIFSTVHKFKGMECDTVRLMDDFSYSDIPHSRPTEESKVRQSPLGS